MLSTPDHRKRRMQELNDDDAEDITHKVTTTYTAKHVMQELLVDITEEPARPLIHTLNVVGTAAEANEWTEPNIPLIDTSGYVHRAQTQSHPQNPTPTFTPSEDQESRWRYYQRPATHSPSPSDPNSDRGPISAEEMAKLGDNDPFLQAIKEAGILSDQSNQFLDTIEEGEEEVTNSRLYNEDIGEQYNPHGMPDSKRYKGRRDRDNRKHNAIMNTIANSKGIYRVKMSLKLQHDSGANICVTNNIKLLVNVQDSDMKVNGCSDTGTAMTCTKVGFLPWYSKTGERLLIKCYYSAAASGTIISTSAIVKQYSDRYSGWSFVANQDSRSATLQLTARDGISHTDYELYEENLLWYHYLTLPSEREYTHLNKVATAVCRTLSKQAEHEL